MTLGSIGIFIAGAILVRLIPARWRGWALMVGSVVAIYWLQPFSVIRGVDFALPTATLALAVIGWLATRPPPQPDAPASLAGEDRITLLVLAGLVAGLALTGDLLRLLPSPPPSIVDLALVMFAVTAIVVTLGALIPDRNRALWILIGLIVALFVVQKAVPLHIALAGWLRAQAGRPLTLAGVSDIGWLGFSYVAFRLIHTLRDRQMGKLPALSLREYLTYLIFFPAYTAGPIDRAERFVKDFRAMPSLDAPRAVEGAGRIAAGLVKKFVIADSLALFALNETLAGQARTAPDVWLLLYAFAFRLYFDFSGYTDIAIGIGRLYGINLPENFNLPYLKRNITLFWQSWHMTLSTWARLYVFTPLSRALLMRQPRPSPALVVLLSQVATMLVIGLWHGITANFALWGMWHAVGLFAHKQYTDRTRAFYQRLESRPALRRLAAAGGILVTFHFVALGWVWFALPDPALSARVLARLFGAG